MGAAGVCLVHLDLLDLPTNSSAAIPPYPPPLCAASIPAWYIWIYWINPLAYAIRALLVNEMNTNAWGMPVVVGMDGTAPQYDALGLLALQSRGFQMQTWCVYCRAARVCGGGGQGQGQEVEKEWGGW